MKASELRVGNEVEGGHIVTIQYNKGKWGCTVSPSKFSSGAGWVFITEKDLKPITLTEEWLLKFGYQYANENGQKFYWHIEMPYFQLRRDEDCFLLWYDEDSIEALICKDEIKYVHQLQNLYFALTGEELQIK